MLFLCAWDCVWIAIQWTWQLEYHCSCGEHNSISYEVQGKVWENSRNRGLKSKQGKIEILFRLIGGVCSSSDTGFHRLECSWSDLHRWSQTPIGPHVTVLLRSHLGLYNLNRPKSNKDICTLVDMYLEIRLRGGQKAV